MAGAHDSKKAELDSEGIGLVDSDRVDLDKEGIAFSEKTAQKKAETDMAEGESVPDGNRIPSMQLYILLAVVVLMFVLAWASWMWLRSVPEVETPAAPVEVTRKAEPVYIPQTDVELDPFVVLFDPIDEASIGVLIARLSLSVNPATAANVDSRLFRVRQKVVDRLSTNVQIYSKNEIANMIRQDLVAYDVKDAVFIQYDVY